MRRVRVLVGGLTMTVVLSACAPGALLLIPSSGREGKAPAGRAIARAAIQPGNTLESLCKPGGRLGDAATQVSPIELLTGQQVAQHPALTASGQWDLATFSCRATP